MSKIVTSEYFNQKRIKYNMKHESVVGTFRAVWVEVRLPSFESIHLDEKYNAMLK